MFQSTAIGVCGRNGQLARSHVVMGPVRGVVFVITLHLHTEVEGVEVRERMSRCVGIEGVQVRASQS